MKRREFIQRTTAAAAGAIVTTSGRPAHAQAHKDTLLTVSESGPNSLDIMGLGINRPAYESSWNTYDRLDAEAGAICRRRRQNLSHRLRAEGQIHDARPRGADAGRVQFRAGEETRDGPGSLGSGLAEEQRRRQRCLPRRKIYAWSGTDLPAVR